MKTFIKITAPRNYLHNGQTMYINPDEVSVIFVENQATVIELKNNSRVFSSSTVEEVIKLINDNASK